MHGGIEHPASPRVGGWTMRTYRRVVFPHTLWFGTAALLLVLFQAQGVFVWTVFLALFVLLGWRIALRHGHELHAVAAAVFIGVPVGTAIAVSLLLMGRLDGSAASIVRWPLLVSFFGAIVMSGTYLMIKGFPPLHHVLLAHHPHKKIHRHRS